MTPIFCALDTTNLKTAQTLSGQMSEAGVGVKLGMEFFYAHGPQGIQTITKQFPELPIFLDLKSHDIPTTVMKAYKALLPLQPAYVNLHTLGAGKMMLDAVQGLQEEADKQGVIAPQVLGVTILTSHDETELASIGLSGGPEENVIRLGKLAQQSGLSGVVCSGKEITALKENCGSDFILMVPGIRPAGADVQDQKRVMTPFDAFQAGANHLVIGRPITEAADPAKAAYEILQSLKL